MLKFEPQTQMKTTISNEKKKVYLTMEVPKNLQHLPWKKFRSTVTEVGLKRISPKSTRSVKPLLAKNAIWNLWKTKNQNDS